MLKAFLSLIFPKICSACGNGLYDTEDCICTLCQYQLPKTDFHLNPDNPIIKLFWGRADIFSASSCYKFSKGSKVQHLIHQLKYRGQKEIGKTIGKFYGSELKESALFNSVNTIMPVPLHPKKLRKRGYNQSDSFAEGLAESMKVESDLKNLVRTIATETQTKKSRFARFKNVDSIFAIKNSEKLEGKHILLVDDVVTTGSTLEACANKLLEIQGTKVSVVTIACADH